MKGLNCGSEISASAKECSVCGKKISVFNDGSFKSDSNVDSYGAYDPNKDSTNYRNSKTPYGKKVKRRSDKSFLTKVMGLAIAIVLIYIAAGAAGLLGIDNGKYELKQIKEGTAIRKANKSEVSVVIKEDKYVITGTKEGFDISVGNGEIETMLTNVTFKTPEGKIEGRFNWFTKTIVLKKNGVEYKFDKK